MDKPVSKAKVHNLKFSYSLVNIALDQDFPLYWFHHDASNDEINQLHNHDVIEIGLCLEGYGLFIQGKKIQSYKPGDVIVMGPLVYHRANNSNPDKKNHWIFFYFNPKDWNAQEIPPNSMFFADRNKHRDFSNLLGILYHELEEKQQGYREIAKGLIISISSYIVRQLSNQEGIIESAAFDKRETIDSRILRALDLLTEFKNLDCPISEVAERCYLSESHFRQLFRDQIGISPKEFQTEVKLKVAMAMLRDKKKSILDISLECGFDSLCNFNRQFKNKTGQPPSVWRKNPIVEISK
ncbi:transcriptional regulator containing an amidase domain and an AraC-type DNA-binding HTH domain [Sphaerochaeta pleomorpha str. Grapes]|uniref:Transcriptional regulator containing an amidase domain and an AraC-type DNA-binding HTH domain n=1 Tax=Sphaerochaeta pleomorpha (strain ATCC BAA-1885 / DSM 22778 / Grapes) TaxID=158190 RepID=G8QQI5_SPHPG|nr:AraC family transcriptional regulator [Sphaerochaeta pleomorpha]AEV30915.1 transcriptional regulator containing an amidase domain and an AraC-type DNA-binding HTH domain [Sphaerochaeta pleomorpha str. Grapes]